ncbi:hypothetical protein SLA2020_252330 [Shorea laevis]
MSLLHLPHAPPAIRSSPSLSAAQPIAASGISSCKSYFSLESSLLKSISAAGNNRKKHSTVLRVRSSLETTTVTVGQVTEVTKDTFWPIVKAAGDKAVVVDMYTQWCGPCKVIAPKFQELSQTYLDVVFLKLDCNQENRPLAKELGIRVVPTFKILKDNKVVKEVTGAKFDDLVLAIETVRSS